MQTVLKSFHFWLWLKEHDISLIPPGMYCYGANGTCPFWEKTDNGAYCAYLNEHSEYYDIGSLIWDQVKECDVNRHENEEWNK